MELIVQGFHWELPSEYIYKCYIWKKCINQDKKKKNLWSKTVPDPWMFIWNFMRIHSKCTFTSD